MEPLPAVRPDRLTLERLLARPVILAALVSPDCRYIAWSEQGADERVRTLVARTDALHLVRPLADDAYGSAPMSWAADSSSLVVAHDVRGDERVSLHLHDIGEGAPPRRITDEGFTRGGALHANAIDYAAERELIRQELATGRCEVLFSIDEGVVTAPHLSPSGAHVLALVYGADVRMFVVDDAGARRVHLPHCPRTAMWLDDTHVVLTLEEGDQTRAAILDVDSGELTWLADDVEMCSVVPGSDDVVIVECRDARRITSVVDRTSGARRMLGSSLPLARLPDGRWLSLEHDRLVYVDEGRVEDYRWPSSDGLMIQGWLYRATAPSHGLIVVAHPGPHAHAEERPEALIEYLIARGFDVLAPNYRGSTGFGTAFLKALERTGCGGVEQHDIWTGVESLIARGVARRGAIGITGFSYGGFCAWSAVTHGPKELFAAAAPISGVTDLRLDYESTQADLRPLLAALMGGTPETVPERYRDRSPIHAFERITAKLLLVHGRMDSNVPMEQWRATLDALDVARVPYESLLFEDEGHGVRRFSNRRILFERLGDFFESALQVPTALSPGSAPRTSTGR